LKPVGTGPPAGPTTWEPAESAGWPVDAGVVDTGALVVAVVLDGAAVWVTVAVVAGVVGGEVVEAAGLLDEQPLRVMTNAAPTAVEVIASVRALDTVAPHRTPCRPTGLWNCRTPSPGDDT
jgi:hypothetical protein